MEAPVTQLIYPTVCRNTNVSRNTYDEKETNSRSEESSLFAMHKFVWSLGGQLNQ